MKNERIITPMPQSLVAAVDDYRFAARVPSRAEAIRRLLEIGLASIAPPPRPADDEPQPKPKPKPVVRLRSP
jgi:hypothetical protein